MRHNDSLLIRAVVFYATAAIFGVCATACVRTTDRIVTHVAAAEAPQALHAKSWAFGRSADRDNPIWRRGVTAENMVKEATGSDPAPDTAEAEGQADHAKSSVGLSVQKETSAWKVAPIQQNQPGGELMARDKRQVVRAFADVEASDNLSIRLGPELSFKDESHADEGASAEQPDTVFGLGMKFQYDF